MQQLLMITLRELDVGLDWRAVHDRLLDDFAGVSEVLATTTPRTILIAHEGPPEIDGWLESIGEAILSRRLGSRTPKVGRKASGGSPRAAIGTSLK